MRNTVLLSVAALAIAGAGLLVMRSGGGDAKIVVPDEYDFIGVCVACKAEGVGRFQLQQKEPFPCGSCAQNAVFRWRYCGDCHKRTIPALAKDAEGVKRVPPFPQCPVCHCSNVSIWDQNMPDQTPKGDNKLPSWP